MADDGLATDDAQRSFTRDEVERIVADRLHKLRGERDTLKRELASANERLATVEQLEGRVESLTQQRDEARDQARTTSEQALNTQMRAEVTTAAVKRGAVDADDVFRLLPDGAVTVNADSGRIEGVDEAVGKLVDAKPHLFSPSPRPGPSDGGARSDSGNNREPQQPPDMNQLLRGNRST